MALLLWAALPLLAAAQPSCGAWQYRPATVPSCSTTSAEVSITLRRFEAMELVRFDAGTPNVQLVLEGDPNVHIKLVDELLDRCVVGVGCLYSQACAGADPCISHAGMRISFGDAGAGAKAARNITVTGVLSRPMSVVLLATAATSGTTVRYSFDGFSSCQERSPLDQCANCSAFQGCRSHDLPVCTGDPVLSCLEQSTLVVEAFSGADNEMPPLCRCCDLPFNATPVKFGTALTLDMDTGKLAFDLRRSYLLFFNWLNSQRGGICVGGERRPAVLELIGDNGLKAAVEAITHYLVTRRNIQFVLAPYGSSLTEKAAKVVDELGAVLVAPASSSTSVFRGRPQVFGTLPPADKSLGGVFEVLQASPNTVVGTILESSSFARAACSTIPVLAHQYGLVVGQSRTLSSSPTSDEILTAVREVLDRQNGALIGCVRNGAVCNQLMSAVEQLGIDPQAIALTVCVMTNAFDRDAGRFALGTTAWLPQLEFRSAAPAVDSDIHASWTSSGWASMYSEAYAPRGGSSFVVSYQAASTWAACVTLVTAIEQAGSTAPSAVADALRNISLDTIFGRIAFDANGQNSGLWNIVQYQGADNNVRFVAPLGMNLSSAVFPMPGRSQRQCWLAEPEDDVMGFDSSSPPVCGDCTQLAPAKVSRFEVAAARRLCRSCPAGQEPAAAGGLAVCVPACQAGRGLSTNGSCVLCGAGEHSSAGLCVGCGPGRFADAPGQDECRECPAGRLAPGAGATACGPCPAGLAASQAQSTSCRACSRGTFAGVNGSSSCTLCAAGTVAVVEQSTACDICAAGTYSFWGAQRCAECQSGRYQNQRQQSHCVLGGGLGATFEGRGLSTGVNKHSYWARMRAENLSWEFCLRAPDACLTQERCADGAAGLHCAACVPGYAHVRARGSAACFRCPHPALNLAMTALAALATVALVFWLAQNTALSTRRPQDMRMMLVKAFIFYSIFADIAFELTTEVIQDYLLQQKMSTAGDTWQVMANIVYALATPFRWLPGFAIQSESSAWSIHCLLQPRNDGLAETLASLPHSSYYMQAYGRQWDEFSRYLHDAELRVTIFWAIWPLLIAAIAYAIGLVHVVRLLRQRREFYSQALGFYTDLLDIGTKHSIRARTQDAWTAYVRTYNSRIAGLWWPIPHAEALRDGARFLNWRTFNREAKPLVHCALLVCHGGALAGLMRSWNCVRFGSEDSHWMDFANSIPCMDFSLLLYQLGLAATLFWGLIFPVLVWISLKRVTSRSHWNSGLDEHCVLLQGYSFHAWYWEAIVMFMKFLLLLFAHAGAQVEVKNVLLLLLAMAYGFLSTVMLPYQATHHNLSGRINGHFILLWIFQFIYTQLVMITAVQSPPAWLMLLQVVFVIICHLAFLLEILHHFIFQAIDSFMIGVDVKAWMRSLEEPRSRNFLTFFRRRMLNEYMRQLARKPYVCLDSDFNWVTVCGSCADQAAVPEIPRGQKAGLPLGRPELSAVPAVPAHPQTKVAREAHHQALQASLQAAVGLVIEVLGMTTFSISLLEFVMRAGIVFAIGHEKQRRQLSNLHRKLTSDQDISRGRKKSRLEEVTVTATSCDPMELLASGPEAEGAEGAPPRSSRAGGKQSLWQVAKFKLQKAAEAESEEILEYRRLCEEVREHELVRFGGDVPDTRKSVSIRKRASAAMNQSIVLVQAFSAATRIWAWLQVFITRTLHEDEERTHRKRSRMSSRSFLEQELADEPTVTPEVHMKYRRKIELMFMSQNYARGIELGSLQLGFMDLVAVPPQEMRHWLDKFEERWVKQKDVQSHQVKVLAGLVKDNFTQTVAPQEETVSSGKQSVRSARDHFTTNWLPKLGILPVQGPRGRKEAGKSSAAFVDASTQTLNQEMEMSALPKERVFRPMGDPTARATLAWAHLVMVASMPDLKAVTPLLKDRTCRTVKNLTMQLEVAKARLEATKARRTALERQRPSGEATGSTSGKKVLPPARKGMYED